MWSWSRNRFKSNTRVRERDLNVIMIFNVVNWRFFLQEKASHLFLGCPTSLFPFGFEFGKQFPLCPCLICVYAVSFFVPVSLNVASDDDDVHMACFSSRSLKTLWSFLSNRCAVHFDIYKVHTPTNALYITLDRVLKFALKSLWLAPTCFGLRPSSGSLH